MKSDLIIQCNCGNLWFMDYEPAPIGCQGDIWRVGVVEWGTWVDREGNVVTV